jgi:hypothetical protein
VDVNIGCINDVLDILAVSIRKAKRVREVWGTLFLWGRKRIILELKFPRFARSSFWWAYITWYEIEDFNVVRCESSSFRNRRENCDFFINLWWNNNIIQKVK